LEPDDAGSDLGAGSERGAARSGGGDVRAGASIRGAGALRGSLLGSLLGSIRDGAEERGLSLGVGREYPRDSSLICERDQPVPSCVFSVRRPVISWMLGRARSSIGRVSTRGCRRIGPVDGSSVVIKPR